MALDQEQATTLQTTALKVRLAIGVCMSCVHPGIRFSDCPFQFGKEWAALEGSTDGE